LFFRLENYRNSRRNLDRTDLAFPDEVDTPKHIPASTRFARYRGLKSFRTSPWDPYENLPVDYAKIFGFEDYDKTGRRVLREGREVGVEVNLGCVPLLFQTSVLSSCFRR
jgi:pre-rRNA-processing protein TSR1